MYITDERASHRILTYHYEARRTVSTDRKADTRHLIDSWWAGYVESGMLVTDSDTARTVNQAWLADQWPRFDIWWDIYTETGHSTALELADVLEQSTENWSNADGPFDTDPLNAYVTNERCLRGPLQPSREEDWSQWLAQLLCPFAELVTELFGADVDHAPDDVWREDQLLNPNGKTRFADILVCYDDRGFSVEVKIADEGYRKTTDTVGLIEQQYDGREWTHVLLLPKSKTDRLRAILNTPIETDDDGRLYLDSNESEPIAVLHWEDVTESLRSILRRDAAVDDHWTASAYLFCALVEQQILGFKPRPVIERLAAPSNVVDTIQPIFFADALEKQLTYLRTRTEL